MSAHQFPASSNRSDQIVKFCDNSQENSCTYKTEQHEKILALKWDNTEIQAFPCNHSFKTSFKCKHHKSNLLAEKTATLFPDFENLASAIELIKEFDCNKYSYTDRALTLLNSPCGLSEVNVFPTDCANCVEQRNKNLHFNSALDHKGLFDFCVTKDSDTSINSILEVDSNKHVPHRKNCDSSPADCIFPNIYNSESFLQEQPFTPYIHPEIAKEQFTSPLLEWDVPAEQELSALKFVIQNICKLKKIKIEIVLGILLWHVSSDKSASHPSPYTPFQLSNEKPHTQGPHTRSIYASDLITSQLRKYREA
ncbi:hypothetical protein MA16_Dca024092 [Dendrobium catenatum]|uniref:Uncharacterized protein n=1 Tax=Dendrobium catenatum TaxID=906689 RepID=A0A2I0VT68_9ASPA|nr:hypothetical protein MA16_Dca024092 [Dendrobium catenatum]